MIGNFEFVEKQNYFRNNGLKFNRLCHKLDDTLTHSIDDTAIEQLREYIEEYDTLNENLEFPCDRSIEEKIRKRYLQKEIAECS